MLINAHTHHIIEADISVINTYPYESFPEVIAPNMYSCGIHPWHIFEEDIEKSLLLIKGLCESKSIQAIGECGLDKNIEDMELQMHIFKDQIKLSEEFGLPVIIHSVKTHHLITEIRKKVKARQNWMIHGFCGSVETAHQLIKQKNFLSFGEFLMKHPEKMKSVLKQVDLNFVLLETDDKVFPIETLYKQVANWLGISLEYLETQITHNFKRFFNS
jgi:TatD DNase family protein